MHAFIIVGSDTAEREEKTRALLLDWQTADIDIVLLTPQEDSIGIREIREFEKRLQLTPYASQTTVGVIADGQLLTDEAQNALLKTLEEPPPRVRLIIQAAYTHTLLPTVLSRCQRICVVESKIAPHEEILRTLTHLVEAPNAQKFALIDTIATDRIHALTFISASLAAVEKKLRHERGDIDSRVLQKNAALGRKLLWAHRLLSANVTPKMVLDELFLSFA